MYLNPDVLLNDVRAIRRLALAPFHVAFPTGKVAVALAHSEGQTPEYRAWLQAKRESKARWFGLCSCKAGEYCINCEPRLRTVL